MVAILIFIETCKQSWQSILKRPFRKYQGFHAFDIAALKDLPEWVSELQIQPILQLGSEVPLFLNAFMKARALEHVSILTLKELHSYLCSLGSTYFEVLDTLLFCFTRTVFHTSKKCLIGLNYICFNICRHMLIDV